LYALQDVDGSVTALVNNNQAVVERYKYDPSGAVTYLNPDFTARSNSSVGWNLLWQTGYRDPLTGIYLGSDGAYHERLGRPLNPRCAMAQTEADFEQNYQRAVDTADPATFNTLQPPPKERAGIGFWGVVGSIAVGLVIGAIATAFLPVSLAVLGGLVIGGAVTGLAEYELDRRAKGEDVDLGAAAGATLLGGLLGAVGGYAFKALGWVARGVGRLTMAAGRTVLRGGRAIGATVVKVSNPKVAQLSLTKFADLPKYANGVRGTLSHADQIAVVKSIRRQVQKARLQSIELGFTDSYTGVQSNLFRQHLGEQILELNRLSMFHPNRLAANIANYGALTNKSIGGTDWVDYMRKVAAKSLLGPKPTPVYPGQRFAAAHTLDSVAGGDFWRFIGWRDLNINSAIGRQWVDRLRFLRPGQFHR
jgi:hypothetical protein